MNILLIFKLMQQAAELLPVAVKFATVLQAVLPASTPGYAKLDTLKSGLQTVIKVQGMAVDEFEQVWPYVSGMLTPIIDHMKATQVNGFTSSAGNPPEVGTVGSVPNNTSFTVPTIISYPLSSLPVDNSIPPVMIG